MLVLVLVHTKKIWCALRRDASVFFFPNVTSFSANRCASFALCHVVAIDSCLNSDVTRLRRSACRCAEDRLSARYFMCPPAIMKGNWYRGKTREKRTASDAAHDALPQSLAMIDARPEKFGGRRKLRRAILSDQIRFSIIRLDVTLAGIVFPLAVSDKSVAGRRDTRKVKHVKHVHALPGQSRNKTQPHCTVLSSHTTPSPPIPIYPITSRVFTMFVFKRGMCKQFLPSQVVFKIPARRCMTGPWLTNVLQMDAKNACSSTRSQPACRGCVTGSTLTMSTLLPSQ